MGHPRRTKVRMPGSTLDVARCEQALLDARRRASCQPDPLLWILRGYHGVVGTVRGKAARPHKRLCTPSSRGVDIKTPFEAGDFELRALGCATGRRVCVATARNRPDSVPDHLQ